MTALHDSQTPWGASYRLIAAEKWRAKSTAMGARLTEALLEFAQPRSGMQVLDLATGTGEPAITLAQRVGDEGHVSGVDLSADLLRIAARRAQERGLANLSFHQGDAHELPFPDESFDLATCRFGVMFFADVDKALGELRRVLRPGARACFVAWGSFDQPYWQSTMGVVVKHAGEPAIMPGGQDPFRFAQAGSLPAALRRAGFNEASEETKAVPWNWPGEPEELWEYARSVSVPFRAMLDRVPEEKWPEIETEVHAALRKHAGKDGVHFDVLVVMASGTR
jgi:SAM-dependent methyltransferase